MVAARWGGPRAARRLGWGVDRHAMRNPSADPTGGQFWRRRTARAVARAVLLLPVVFFVAGGSPWANWVGDRDEGPPDEAADRLYNEGVYLLNEKKQFKDAAKKFEEVDRQHPYGDWARKALLMSAYTNYQSKSYDDAVAAAKRYVALHPGSDDAG